MRKSSPITHLCSSGQFRMLAPHATRQPAWRVRMAWGCREDAVPSCRLRTWLIVRFQQLALLGQLSLTVINETVRQPWHHKFCLKESLENHLVYLFILWYHEIFNIQNPDILKFLLPQKIDSAFIFRASPTSSASCCFRWPATFEVHANVTKPHVLLKRSFFQFLFRLFSMPLFAKKKIPTSKADLVSVNLANVWCSCLSSKSANFCARSLTSILEWAGDMAIDWFFWICDSAKWQMMPRRLLLGHLWTQQIAVPQQGTTKTTWGVRNIMALFRTLQAVHAPKTNKLLRKTHHNIITVPHFI